METPTALPIIPVTARAHLRNLYIQYQSAQNTYQAAFTTAMEMLGLDPQGQWEMNFDSGVVKPAQPQAPPVSATSVMRETATA